MADTTSPHDQLTTAAPGQPSSDLDDKVAEAERIQQLQEEIFKALKSVYDPEIPVNIHELGLIYDVDVTADGLVHIRMTLTSPACPAAGSLPGEVQARVRAIEGIRDAEIELVWEPPWNPNLMSEAAKLQLGIF